MALRLHLHPLHLYETVPPPKSLPVNHEPSLRTCTLHNGDWGWRWGERERGEMGSLPRPPPLPFIKVILRWALKTSSQGRKSDLRHAGFGVSDARHLAAF